VVTLPSGDSSVITNRRSAVRSDSPNPFTLVSETDLTVINGQLWTTAYDATAQRVTSTSPAGRQSFTTLDSLGRVRVVRTPGLDSVVYGYDARGRLSQVQTGGRWRVTPMTGPAGWRRPPTPSVGRTVSDISTTGPTGCSGRCCRAGGRSHSTTIERERDQRDAAEGEDGSVPMPRHGIDIWEMAS
jgi:hypothetical protein